MTPSHYLANFPHHVPFNIRGMTTTTFLQHVCWSVHGHPMELQLLRVCERASFNIFGTGWFKEEKR